MRTNPIPGGWLAPDPEVEADEEGAGTAAGLTNVAVGAGLEDTDGELELELEALAPLWQASAPSTDEAALGRLEAFAACAVDAQRAPLPPLTMAQRHAPPQRPGPEESPGVARSRSPRAWRGRFVAVAVGLAAAMAAVWALALRRTLGDGDAGVGQRGGVEVAAAVGDSGSQPQALAGGASADGPAHASAGAAAGASGAVAADASAEGAAGGLTAAVTTSDPVTAVAAAARDDGPGLAEGGQAFDLVASADFDLLDSSEDEGLFAGSLLSSLDADLAIP